MGLPCILPAPFLLLVPRVGRPESDCATSRCTTALASSAEAVAAVNDAAIENGSDRPTAATPLGEVDARDTGADRAGISAPGIVDVGGVVWIGPNDPEVAIDVAILGLGGARSKTTAVPIPVAKMMLNTCSIAVCVAPSSCGRIRQLLMRGQSS